MKIYTNIEENKSIIYKDNKNKAGIYKFLNTVNGKFYIGSSINLGQRLTIYLSKKAMLGKIRTRTSIIYSALLKHGFSNFTLEILEFCDKKILIEREQYYIDLLKPKYNIMKAANSRLGSKHSLETRILIGLKQKGILHNNYGKTLSPETRKRISESLKSVIRVKNKPNILTNETRLKMSLKCGGVNVKVWDRSNKLVFVFPTITSAAKHFNVSNKTISRYLDNGKTINGFIFKSSFIQKI